jgi:hypothetical protein
MPPGACRRDSSEWDPREIAGVIGLVLFVGSSVTWKSLAEVVVPQLDSRENVRRDPRVLAVLAARFAGEIYGLLAAAPLILCLICGRGWIVGPAAVLSLWFFAYFALGLVFVPQVAAFEELGVVDSLVRSWSLARGRRLRLLAYHAALRGGLALAACSVVGLFFAAPLVNLSRIESYLALTRALDREAPRA